MEKFLNTDTLYQLLFFSKDKVQATKSFLASGLEKYLKEYICIISLKNRESMIFTELIEQAVEEFSKNEINFSSDEDIEFCVKHSKEEILDYIDEKKWSELIK